MQAERDNDIEDGRIQVPAPCRRRSDAGKKWCRESDDSTTKRHLSKKHRSRSVIESDEEDDADGPGAESTTAATAREIEAWGKAQSLAAY
jgi:hypothetical protein